jgi:hypothetical protein
MDDLRTNSHRRTLALALVIWTASTAAQCAAAEKPVRWLTGPQLEKQRGERIGLTWSGMPLRRGLASLAHSQRIAVLLDRRIDPDRTVELTFEDGTIDEVFARIARDQSLGLSWFGPLAYFAPPAAARRLRTVTALRENEAAQLPSKKISQALLRRRAWKWDDLAVPREVVEKLAGEEDLKLDGLAQIPHDLWPAAEGPPMTLVARLSLLLGEFDLTVRFDDGGRTLVLVAVPDQVAIEKSYPGGKDPRATARRWSKLVPDCQIQVAAGKVVVRGLVEDHEKLTGQEARTAPATVKTGELRYTLTIQEKPLGSVLKQLAEKLKLELHFDSEALADAGISLDQFVSFKVEEATVDELFAAALKPTGLSFRREGAALKVFPADE